MYKISEYKTALNFEGRSGRNFADWLRADRESNPERIENEIAYDIEFVRRSLRKRLQSIEKKYPESFAAVSEFVNGADLNTIQAKFIIKQIVQHEEIETEQDEHEVVTEQPEPETENEPIANRMSNQIQQLIGSLNLKNWKRKQNQITRNPEPFRNRTEYPTHRVRPDYVHI